MPADTALNSGKVVFPTAQRAEDADRVIAGIRVEGVGAVDQGGLMAAQEGVAGALQGHAGGQGRCVARALFGGLFLALRYERVLWVYLCCEAQIAEGIFVGAIDGGILRQCGELLQAVEHLRCRALKEAPATCGEEGVAAEKRVFPDIGEMIAGMTGHFQHGEQPLVQC